MSKTPDLEKRPTIYIWFTHFNKPYTVNYPALTDGALGFPVAFTAHLHFPFRVFTYPRPVSLVKARAMVLLL
jgi:hypothetical protein